MIVGNKQNFAIEFEISNPGKDFLLGEAIIWIKNYKIEKPGEESALGTIWNSFNYLFSTANLIDFEKLGDSVEDIDFETVTIENENFDIHFDICDTFFDWVFYTAKKSDELLLIWRYDGYYSDDEINRETSWHSELLNIEAMKDCINEFKHILSLNH